MRRRPTPLPKGRGHRHRRCPRGVGLFLFLIFASAIVRAQDVPPPPPPPVEAAPAPTTAPDEAVEPPKAAAPAGTQTPNESQTGHRRHDDHPPAPRPQKEHEYHGATLPTDASRATPAEVFGIDFMRRALLAGLIVCGVCAYLGVYVVLRRIVFVGVALAQMSSAGVALSLLAGIAPLLGSAGLMLFGVVLLSIPWAPRKVRQDAFTGAGYVVASAMAIILLAKSPQGEGHLLNLLFGNILLVTPGDVLATAFALGGVLLVHALVGKEMLFVTFDPDTAAATGYRTRLWEGLLYVTIGLTIAFAIHTAGVLLTFASLVIPAITALLLTRRMSTALAASVAVGLTPVPVGLYLSFVWDLPSAATIVVLGAALLVIGGLVSRLRSA